MARPQNLGSKNITTADQTLSEEGQACTRCGLPEDQHDRALVTDPKTGFVSEVGRASPAERLGCDEFVATLSEEGGERLTDDDILLLRSNWGGRVGRIPRLGLLALDELQASREEIRAEREIAKAREFESEQLRRDLDDVHTALAESNVPRSDGVDEPLYSEAYRVRLLGEEIRRLEGERDAFRSPHSSPPREDAQSHGALSYRIWWPRRQDKAETLIQQAVADYKSGRAEAQPRPSTRKDES